MAVTLLDSTTTGNTALASTRAVPVPTGGGALAANDVVVVRLSRWESINPAVTLPAGTWISRTQLVNGSAKLNTYLKRLTGSDTGTYTFSWTGSMWTTGQAMAYRGVSSTADLSTIPLHQLTASGTAWPALTLSSIGAGALDWHGYSENGGTHVSPTTPAFTQVENNDSDASAYAVVAAGSYTTSGGSSVSSSLMGSMLHLPEAASGTTPVTGTRATTWRVRAVVTATRATTWRVRSAASATRATTWRVRSATVTTRATTWRVTARVTATRATLWSADAMVTSSRTSTWRTAARATSSRATTWRATSAVTAFRSSAWNVASTISTVTATRPTSWGVDARVTSTRSTTWDTRQAATSTRVTTWAVHGLTTTARTTTWDVLSNPTATRSTIWRTRARVSVARSTSWAVGEGVYVPPKDVTVTVGPTRVGSLSTGPTRQSLTASDTRDNAARVAATRSSTSIGPTRRDRGA